MIEARRIRREGETKDGERNENAMKIKSLFKRPKPTAAVFVDFEHWCYSLDRLFGLRPKIEDFYKEISEAYYVKRIYFFGDFTEPKMSSCIDEIRMVTNNIIDTQNPSQHLKKDYTDFIMLDCIYQDADDNPRTDVYIIFSGDGHFTSVAAYLKNRKRKKIVIYGVVEATSQKLKNIADEFHLLPMKREEKSAFYRMILDDLDYVASQNRTVYATFKTTVRAVSEKNSVAEEKVTAALQDLINMGVVRQELIRVDFQDHIKVLKVNWDVAVGKGYWSFENARPMAKSRA